MNRNIIIYADDDLDDINMLQDCMKDNGQVTLLPAYNGHDALELIDRLNSEQVLPCLVILDINMPVLNGKDTLLKMKSDSNLKNIPVVLFSTTMTTEDKNFATTNGVEFISKPRSFKELEITTNRFLEKCNFEL
ncbi:MAG: response regulator [Flavisolibacter sp.]|jgi:CheY-like chemotaxis protein